MAQCGFCKTFFENASDVEVVEYIHIGKGSLSYPKICKECLSEKNPIKMKSIEIPFDAPILNIEGE